MAKQAKQRVGVLVRLSRAERREIARAAAAERLTVQDWARRRLLAGIVPEGVRAGVVPAAESAA